MVVNIIVEIMQRIRLLSWIQQKPKILLDISFTNNFKDISNHKAQLKKGEVLDCQHRFLTPVSP